MAIFGRKVMNNRITILGIVVLFLLSLDVARIFYLQVLKGDEYAAKAESQQLSDTEIPAMRGTIYDSDGNILAQSATVWTVYLDPLNIKEKQRPVLIAELTKLFDLDEEEAKALEEKTRQKNHYVIVREPRWRIILKSNWRILLTSRQWPTALGWSSPPSDIIRTARWPPV